LAGALENPRDAILFVPLANPRDTILLCDLGNFLEGIFLLVFGNFLAGIFAIKLTWGEPISHAKTQWDGSMREGLLSTLGVRCVSEIA
jgi:hypothetical protein